MDAFEATNEEFGDFVAATGYRTDSERFGWSFVFDLELEAEERARIESAVLGVEWWLAVKGAYWREPTGPGSDVFNADKLDYPVVQVSW